MISLENSIWFQLDERALTLLKDLLDHKWETTLRTYSEVRLDRKSRLLPIQVTYLSNNVSEFTQLITIAQPNQPPPAVRQKRQCRYCQQRSLKRQASINHVGGESETQNRRDSKFMEVVHLMKVPENVRKLVQPKQVFVHEIRSVASSANSGSNRIRPRRTESEDSRRFDSGFSYSSWTSRDESSGDTFSSPESSSSAATDSAATSISTSANSLSSYSIEKPPIKPVRTLIARAGPGRRRGRMKGDKIGAFRRIKNKLGLVFHHHDHHHHHDHGGGTSLWRHVKEMLRRQGGKGSDDDEVVKKGKRREFGSVVELLKQNKPKQQPPASKQRKKNRKRRLHWWQLKRRTEAGRRNRKTKKKSRTTNKC